MLCQRLLTPLGYLAWQVDVNDPTSGSLAVRVRELQLGEVLCCCSVFIATGMLSFKVGLKLTGNVLLGALVSHSRHSRSLMQAERLHALRH